MESHMRLPSPGTSLLQDNKGAQNHFLFLKKSTIEPLSIYQSFFTITWERNSPQGPLYE